MTEEEKLPENNMENDELEFLATHDPVDIRDLTPEQKHELAEAVRAAGASLDNGVFMPEEYFDHGEEEEEK